MGKLWKVDILVKDGHRRTFILKLKKQMPVYATSNGLYVSSQNYGKAKALAKEIRKVHTTNISQVAVIARYAEANNMKYEEAAKLFGPLHKRKGS